MVDFEDLTDEQQTAASTLERNLSVTAGAGTGKTTTLTERYLQMLEHGLTREDPITPEHILTTTFTERAANELKANVREEITARVGETDATSYDEWRTIVDALDLGYIHTLHGFCARLLREHAVRVRAVDPGFETLDETDSAGLIDDMVANVLETHEDREDLKLLARRFTRRDLHAILSDLLGERPESIEWARRWEAASKEEYLKYVQTTLHPITPDTARSILTHPDFEEAVATLREMAHTPPEIDTSDTDWTRAMALLDHLPGEGVFDGTAGDCEVQHCVCELCSLLTTSDGDRYASYNGAKSNWGGCETEKEAFGQAMEAIVEVLEPAERPEVPSIAVDENSFPFVQALASFLLVTVEEYEAQKDQLNVVDFTDQIEYAVNFLSDSRNKEIREELRDTFEYVMVDEFQDTDPRQAALLKLLTSRDPSTFDGQNVFVVGDEKQSIYRFRNAEVTQFEETAQELEAANPGSASGGEQLSVNFRTLPNVLECINGLFDEIFESAPDAPSYEAAPQRLTPDREDSANVGATMEYLCVPRDPDVRARRFDRENPLATARPEHDMELEAMAIAARLTHIFDEPYHVYPTEDDETSETKHTTDGESDSVSRPIEPSDVAILLRSRTHLKLYERALDEHDIPYIVASGLGFYETAEITALINLFKALADPDDERALYGALRSPLFGFTDETLARLKLDHDSLWVGLSESEIEDLQTAYELMQDWRERAGIGSDADVLLADSWASLLTEIIDETGYLVNVSVDERPQQAVANVEKFREQLRGWSRDGITSLTALLSRIEHRREQSSREGEADIPTDESGVQILTIHGAKGMEYPFVVVPGINRSFNDQAAVGNRKIEFEQIDGQPALGMRGPDPDEPYRQTSTIARKGIRRHRRAEERAEEKRVLYVACTRARDHLLLAGLHETGDVEGETPTIQDIEPPGDGDAKSWRDWLQPLLLTEEVFDRLTIDETTTATIGDGTYTVSLPTPPVDDWQGEYGPVDTRFDLSEAPTPLSEQFRLSPTNLASLFAGYGELTLDEDRHVIRYEDAESESESNSQPDGETESDSPAGSELPPSLFGELVHRLCELDPPATEREQFLEQVLVEEDAADVTLPAEQHDDIFTHADRGIEFVNERTVKLDVEYQYDELQVTAEFEHGESSGYIDHLLVTPDAYHIIDYKTNDITSAEIEEKGSYYETQMAVYAIALYQNDPTRRVTASLYFTALDEPWERTWDVDSLSDLETTFEREIQTHIDTMVD